MDFALYDPIYDRIYKRFDINEQTECWEWNGTRTNGGYPTISYQGKTVLVHRKMYELRWGDIPEGYEVDHTCHNPPCICPSHLRAVPVQINRARRLADLARRDDRLRMLIRRYGSGLLCPGKELTSTELAALWQCQSSSIPDLLATMLIYDGFYYTTLRRGNHGPKPSLFQIWLDSRVLEDVDSVCNIRKIRRTDDLVVAV